MKRKYPSQNYKLCSLLLLLTLIKLSSVLNVTFSSFFMDDSDPLQTPTSPIYSTECPENFLCTPPDIYNLINILPHNVSPGYDGITHLLLKATAASIAYPLSQYIFNQSITPGIFPSPWKHSIIIPIPKTSPPSSAPTNYRPISLLCIISKLLEKFMANFLLGHLYLNSHIPPNQFGFLPMRSTTDALISACQDSSIPISAVFLDLKKAFDLVSHPKLIHELNSLNLPSFICHWLTSYLLDRTQSVRVGNNISTPLPVIDQVYLKDPSLVRCFFTFMSTT